MKSKYSEQQKLELVKRYYDGESVSVLCLQTRIPKSTFYSWIKSYKAVGKVLDFDVSAVNYARQRKQIDKLEKMVEVLRSTNCTVTSPLQNKLKELEKLYGRYSVRVLCDSLDVARGTFYNHIYRNKKDKNSYISRRKMLSKHIKEVFEESNQIYGARKIQAVLRTRGINTTDGMVSELMQEMNIQSTRTDTRRQHRRLLTQETKRDVLKLDFTAKAPNQVWVSDVTQFRFCNTTRYICAIIDLYSRKVIAYKISQRHSTQLITSTFKDAYRIRQPNNDLIFHSDRGSQYAAFSFRKLLKMLKITQSFSPPGRPRHNAVIEAFFETLKKEELYRVKYRSIRDFEQSVDEFMKRYNEERPHVTLRYKTPTVYEKAFYGD